MIPGVQEIKALALKYSKKQLANMAQTGLIDPQKAVMAGMMRDRIAQEDMQPPETTVAQDVLGLSPPPQMAQAQMQQMQQPQQMQRPQQMGAPIEQPTQMAASGGLTDIPVKMHDYAGGGIVAFGDGGDVPGFADGSVIDESVYIDPMGVPYNLPPNDDVPRRGTIRGIIPNKGPGFDLRETGRVGDEPGLWGQIFGYNVLPKETAAATTTPTTATTTTSPAGTTTPPTPPAPGARRDVAPRAPAAPAAPRAPAAPAFKRPDIASYLPDISKLKLEQADIRPAQQLDAIGQERMDYLNKMGIDPQLYEKLIEKEEGKRGELTKRKEEAKGQALMEIGLGLIGARRGQEFQTLGTAGQKGLASLREAGKELRAAEEKLDDRINSFRMADQQFKQSGAEKDLTKRENELNRVDAAQRDAAKERNNFAVQTANLGMQAGQIRATTDVALRGQDIQEQLEKQKIAIQQQQAANQAAYYNKSLAITEARIKSMDAASQARMLKLRQESDKMFEASPQYRALTQQLKGQYGDNYMTAEKAKVALEEARKLFFAQQLEGVGALVPAYPDQSSL